MQINIEVDQALGWPKKKIHTFVITYLINVVTSLLNECFGIRDDLGMASDYFEYFGHNFEIEKITKQFSGLNYRSVIHVWISLKKSKNKKTDINREVYQLVIITSVCRITSFFSFESSFLELGIGTPEHLETKIESIVW